MKKQSKRKAVAKPELEQRVEWLEAVIQWLMGTGIVHHTGTWGFPEYPTGKKEAQK